MTNSSQHYKKLSTEQLQEILSSPASSPESIRAAEEELLARGESILFALKKEEPGTYKRETFLDYLYPFNRAHGYADHIINVITFLIVLVVGLPELFFLSGYFYGLDLYMLLLFADCAFHLLMAYLFWRRKKTGWIFLYAFFIQAIANQLLIIGDSAGEKDGVLLLFVIIVGVWGVMIWLINRPEGKLLYKLEKTPIVSIAIVALLLFGSTKLILYLGL